ncbi:MAG: (d)CMP kinase, partial [Prevotellaceae bacterium]|jgi:cytidylate kinase|nr:(d)CMP kinase [Prevotellaceae bacterium]
LFGLQNNIITENSIDEQALAQKISSIKIYFKKIDGVQHAFLNDADVENSIRSLEAGNAASRVSTIGFVRRALVAQQQLMGMQKGIVMDGRDIGTVVFPHAELKIFVTASVEIRAQRRFDELLQKGEKPVFQQVLLNITERDRRDTTRTESPLRQAEDALLLDNSNLTKDEQNALIMKWFESRIK